MRILEEGRANGTFPAAHPDDDARSIYAVTRRLVDVRLAGGDPKDLNAAAAHVLRFCLPALGAAPAPVKDGQANRPAKSFEAK